VSAATAGIVRARLDGADIVAIGVLLLLTAVLLLPAFTLIPLLPWDEARNASNAIEMTGNGNWLVTHFNGAPDHWNTKPPLLIWVIAALLRCDAPPVLAVRLPSALATTGIVLVLFCYGRCVLRDRVTGFAAGFLLVASTSFMGWHIASMGDYDALLSLFVLLYTLCFERALNASEARTAWLAAAAGALALAALTKGIAAFMPAPGLVVWLVVQRRLWSVLRDPTVWLAVSAVVAACGAYYLGREVFDPGYLRAVWHEEIASRYQGGLGVVEHGPLFYVREAMGGLDPWFLLLPLLVLPLRGADPVRRSAVLLAVLPSAALLLALTIARSRLHWYDAPLMPLLSLAVGIGTADCWRALRDRPTVRQLLFGLLGLGFLGHVIWEQVIRNPADAAAAPANYQSRYGPALAAMRAAAPLPPLVIIENGLPHPVLGSNTMVVDFYREVAARRGEIIDRQPVGAALSPGTHVLTCDPSALIWLRAIAFVPERTANGCELGRIPR
jgi:4-amino-4-deoxy-L-arabinose transferase-like glycosyltransferase